MVHVSIQKLYLLSDTLNPDMFNIDFLNASLGPGVRLMNYYFTQAVKTPEIFAAILSFQICTSSDS